MKQGLRRDKPGKKETGNERKRKGAEKMKNGKGKEGKQDNKRKTKVHGRATEDGNYNIKK